jgi:hypothetical protein
MTDKKISVGMMADSDTLIYIMHVMSLEEEAKEKRSTADLFH